MSQPQHDDPFGEIRTQTAQVLAVAATVGEAAARWYAVGLQQRADTTEQRNATDAAGHAADKLANQAQEQQDRHLIDKGLTDWLSRASMEETVRLWRTATIYAASGNTRAAHAARLAQERLRRINTPFMNAYDRHRTAGRNQADAMRAAAYDMWETEARTRAHPTSTARPHGTREHDTLAAGANGKTLDVGGAALDELDAAVRAEVSRLAAHINPEALDKLQRDWRRHGRAPAADAAGLLAQFARDAARTATMPPTAADALTTAATDIRPDTHTGHATPANPVPDRQAETDADELAADADTEQRAAEIASAEPDNPSTPHVDEHHDGHNRARVHTDRADADLAAAGQQQELMRHAFPQLAHIGQMPTHVATQRPATATTTQRRPRTR